MDVFCTKYFGGQNHLLLKIKYSLFFCLVSFNSACTPQDHALQQHADSLSGAASVNSSLEATSTSVSAEKQAGTSPVEVDLIVKDVMDSVYGATNFDPSRQCWKYEFQANSESLDYCMLGVVSKVSSDADGTTVYVQAHSDPQAEIYSQVDPGLQGLFVVGVEAGRKVKMLAAKPAIDMGQAGDCGCLDAKVIQVGPARYGWLSTSRGIWQGVQVTHYSLHVPLSAEIRDVSTIPRVSEKSPNESNDLKVETGGKVIAGMYPLEVTRKRGSTILETRLVSYDEVKGIYPWNP